MRSLLFGSLFLVLLAGCGGDSHQYASVSGRVTLNGKPLSNAAVVFQPVVSGTDTSPASGSGGFTDADGRYTLTVTSNDKPGAAVGKHKVVITMRGDADLDDDRPRKFKRLPAQNLEFQVPSGGTDAANFELKGK
jgi:hypothetical protein